MTSCIQYDAFGNKPWMEVQPEQALEWERILRKEQSRKETTDKKSKVPTKEFVPQQQKKAKKQRTRKKSKTPKQSSPQQKKKSKNALAPTILKRPQEFNLHHRYPHVSPIILYPHLYYQYTRGKR